MRHIFARWSREKARSKAAAEPDHQDATSAEVAVRNPPPLDLPALDDIRPETDIRGFLAAEVAAATRNGALRRLWLIDPAIRDFVGPARDYNFDWTVPGGIPGGGALPSPEEIGRMVDAVLGPMQAAAERRDPPKPAEEEPGDVS